MFLLYNEKLRDYVQSPSRIRRHEFELGHIDKLRMLRIREYWGARLEPVDPDVTSTCHVLD